jgi:hypothetical protein
MLPFFLKVEACLSVDVLQVISYQIFEKKQAILISLGECFSR